MRLGIILLGISITAFNFCWAQYDSTYIFKDFNKDGYTDTLLKFYQGGSGYGGTYIEINSGINDDIFAIETDGCFCQIRQTLIIPTALTKIANIDFLEAIKNELLPSYQSDPDPSLSWMLAAELNDHQLTEDSLFAQIVNPQQPWIKGEFKIPGNYFIEMKGDLLGVYRHNHAASGSSEIMNDEGFMIYYAHNHYANKKDTLELAAENETYKIYKTKHGIIAKKGTSYKWLFISDVFVTGAPQKLRWSSIGKVRIIGKYILFEQYLSPHFYSPIHIINIETGKFGRFTPLINPALDPLANDTESILFTLDNGEVKYSIKSIITAFEDQ